MYIVTQIIYSNVERVWAFAQQSDARAKMIELVVDNLNEWGEDIENEDEAFTFVQNIGGIWQENYIELGDESPIYQLFEVSVQ